MKLFVEDALKFFALGLFILALMFVVQTVRGEVEWGSTSEAFGLFGRYTLVLTATSLVIAFLSKIFAWLGWQDQSPKPRGKIDVALGLVTVVVILFFLVRS